jgi:phage terminase large subunit-like protein
VNFAGDDAIRWIEANCRVPKGPAVGQRMQLAGFQRDILHGLFDTPTRRAIVSMGRQNAKTTLNSCIVLMYLAGPLAQRNGLIVSTALTKEQAGILFDTCAKIIRLSPARSTAHSRVTHRRSWA